MRSYDLKHVLSGWPYQSGQITVRKITGDDGKAKVQMRLDLGMLQMELEGRPDGKRPHGCESLLAYHRRRISKYIRRNGTDLGFELDAKQAQALREEAAMYYHRYLSLFVLEEFGGVERDTERNLMVLDMCHRYAAAEDDRRALEPYRAYLIMMRTRAKVHPAVSRGAMRTALSIVDRGIEDIGFLAEPNESAEEADVSNELTILHALRDEISSRLPADPVVALKAQLAEALNQERYEEAAEIRDRLSSIRGGTRSGASDES